MNETDFQRQLTEQLGLVQSPSDQDVQLDSLQVLEAIVWLEELGCKLSDSKSPGQRDYSTGHGLYVLYKETRGDAERRRGDMIDGRDGPAAIPRVLGTANVRPSTPTSAAASPADRSGREDRLEGGHCLLRPITPHDQPFLYALATSSETGYRWRYRGSHPSPGQFEADLWRDVLTQFMVESTPDPRPLGQVVAYGADFSQGWCYFGIVVRPDVWGTGVAAEAALLFLRHLFTTWPFRKVYVEFPEFNLPAIQSGLGTFYDLEGRLRDHEYYDGRYWDRIIASIRPGQLPPQS